MAVFEWQDSYNLGIQLIDDQHKVLVRIINDLDDLLKQTFSNERLKELFNELVDYTKYHFSTEERIMKTRGYASSQLEAHLKQHQQFVQQITALNHDAASLTRDEGEWVLKYLTNWLINHILKVDRHLVDHLNISEQEMLAVGAPGLHNSLHITESLYEELGANLDQLKEESQQAIDGVSPNQTDLVKQIQGELEEVSNLLKQALGHTTTANRRLKSEN